MAGRLRESEHLPPGTVIEGYVIRSLIGAGGFGVTYLAEHRRLGKAFALKEYFPRGYAKREGATVSAYTNAQRTYRWGLDRFIQEARALARFHHRAIVAVSDVFEANGTAYMVLSYERGRDMRAWQRELGRKPSQAELDALLADLLDALEELHRTGLLHRDIAPDNIYIRTDGTPVLLDFGAARHAIGQQSTAMSAIVKGGYSPPEQYTTEARAQGPWTDIYALGATLYEAVTGRPPPEASARMLDETCAPVARSAAGSGYRPDFLASIDEALRLPPEERPRSIADWRRSLLGGAQTMAVRSERLSAPDSGPEPVPGPRSEFGEAARGHGAGAPSGPAQPPEQPAAPQPEPAATPHRPVGLVAAVSLLALLAAATLVIMKGPGRTIAASSCDQLAAIPHDPAARAAGVPVEALEPALAVEACRRAMASASPAELARLRTQHAYALRAAGSAAEAARLLEAAVADGSAEAHSLLGDMQFEGTPPVAFDRTAACRNYQLAMQGGSLSGTTSFAYCLWTGAGGQRRDERRAGELYRRAAEQGSREAMLFLGLLYRDGRGLPLDVPQAVLWLEKAGSLGEPLALYLLADLYDSGHGVALDRRRAAQLYQQARPGLERMAGAHHVDALNVLGLMHRDGSGIGKDETAAARLFQRAIDLGSGSAMRHLADLHVKGAGLTQDFRRALELLREAIAREDEGAMQYLGDLYDAGRGVPQDYAEAMRWYRAAAERGNAEAMVSIGNLFFNGNGARRDHAEALRWYRLAAERNSPAGLNSVGLMLETGQGTQKDAVEARSWYLRAAELGNADAMRNLGEIYESGNGTAVDGTQAVLWYGRAVDKGSDEALYRLGELYRLGRGVAIDLGEALAWHLRGIEKEQWDSAVSLGLMYESGQGVPRNVGEAARLYRLAAERGNLEAMRNLAVLLEEGRGIARNCAEARSWYTRAAEAGHEDARQRLLGAALRSCR